MNDDSDLYKSSNYLESFLVNNYYKAEKKNKESAEEVAGIKEDVVDNFSKKLESSGVNITGNLGLLEKSIVDEAAIQNISSNVENLVDYRKEREELGINNPVEVDIIDVNRALEEPGDDTILDITLDQEERDANIDNDVVNFYDNGNFDINVNKNDPDMGNFVDYTTLAFVAASDDFELDQPLEMKCTKELENPVDPNKNNAYRVSYGEFPVKDPNFEKDPVMLEKISNIMKNYNSSVNYSQVVNTFSPEIATTLSIVNDHLLENEGSFQVGIKNNGKNPDIIFGLSEHYNFVSDAFSTNGASVNRSIDISVVRVMETSNKEQLSILTSTLSTLNTLSKTKVEESNKTLVYKMEPTNSNSEAANINSSFLIIVVIFDFLLLLFGMFIFFQ